MVAFSKHPRFEDIAAAVVRHRDDPTIYDSDPCEKWLEEDLPDPPEPWYEYEDAWYQSEMPTPQTGGRLPFLRDFNEQTVEELLAEVNRLESEFVQGLRRLAHEFVPQIGRLLMRIKKQVGHGNWTPWLKANFDRSPETARLYLRVAANWDLIVENGLDGGTLEDWRKFLELPVNSPVIETSVKAGAVGRPIRDKRGQTTKTIRLVFNLAEGAEWDDGFARAQLYYGTKRSTETALKILRDWRPNRG